MDGGAAELLLLEQTPQNLLKNGNGSMLVPLNLIDSQFVAKEVGKKSLFLLPLECQLACSALG